MPLPPNIKFVVTICTHNRRLYLEDTITAVLNELAPYPNAKLLIVDNASTDDTPAFLAQLTASNPIVRAVVEPRTGLYFARRRAFLETAEFPFLLAIDDDAIPGPGWAEGLVGELLTNSTIGVVGPAIDAIWEGEPASWCTPHMQRDIPVMSFPAGREEWVYPCFPPGVSFALRRDPCLDYYCGDDRAAHPLGVAPDQRLAESVMGEDNDLCEVYARAGYRLVSVDHVRVGHRVLAHKLTPQWLVDKYQSDGRLRVRLARICDRPLLEPTMARMLLAWPALAVAQIARLFVAEPAAIQIRAYFAKATGAWRELLAGPRVRPYAYPGRRVKASR
jgi:glycosyltransferase involved in cell wall biosynthesis